MFYARLCTEDVAQIKIPSFLDCTINANAKKVIYDNLTLENVKGRLKIDDQAAKLEDVSSNLFDGTVTFDGKVSTKEAISNFDMDMKVDAFDITQSFAQLDLLKAIAPISKIIEGGNILVTLSERVLGRVIAEEIKNPVTGEVIIKKGKDGAELFAGGRKYCAPAYKINKVVDPTGAGDCFIAGIAGYLSEINEVTFESLKSAIYYGTSIASFNLEEVGTKNLLNLPKNKIEERIKVLKEQSE